ncbi:MAG: hypothetical protein ACK4TA_25915, partial [Saprospiraceae bacterium]
MSTSIASFKLLAAENVGKCLQQLSKIIDATQVNQFNTLVNLQFRLNRLNTDKMMNTLSNEEEARAENQLMMDIVTFLDTLTESNFAPGARLKEEIYDKILVVCYNVNAVLQLQAFFDSFYFKNVQYATYELNEDKIAWADVIVFDYMYALENDPNYYDLLRQYLDKTPGKYLLYFGRQDRILEHYPMKVHIARSPFELYARLREMLEFKKFYKAR